jgi:hypothetical protein
MSDRTKRLSRLGNAVVPQAAEWIGRKILELDLGRKLARCDREQEEIRQSGSDKPAWLVALGELDWEIEKQLIRGESC